MKQLRRHDGFTLLEILVAMTVLSVGLLGVAGLTTGVIRGNYFSKNVTTATVIAQSQLENVQRAGYVDATTANFPDDTMTMGNVNFTRDTDILDDTPDTNMKTVVVAVSWQGGAHSITLNTILAQ